MSFFSPTRGQIPREEILESPEATFVWDAGKPSRDSSSNASIVSNTASWTSGRVQEVRWRESFNTWASWVCHWNIHTHQSSLHLPGLSSTDAPHWGIWKRATPRRHVIICGDHGEFRGWNNCGAADGPLARSTWHTSSLWRVKSSGWWWIKYVHSTAAGQPSNEVLQWDQALRDGICLHWSRKKELLRCLLDGPLHLCPPVKVSDQQLEKLLPKRAHFLCHSGQTAALLHCSKRQQPYLLPNHYSGYRLIRVLQFFSSTGWVWGEAVVSVF